MSKRASKRAPSPLLLCIETHKCIIKMFAVLRLCNWNESEDAHHIALFQQNFNVTLLYAVYHKTPLTHCLGRKVNDDSLGDFQMSSNGKQQEIIRKDILCIFSKSFSNLVCAPNQGQGWKRKRSRGRESMFRKDLRIWLFLVNFSWLCLCSCSNQQRIRFFN